jgi:hypothetical protein
MAAARPEPSTAAFYALRPGGWRDLVTLLHPPYTAWHLSYVAIGAALAPHFHLDRLGATLAAFFLAVGISAHALDELKGHPLQTRLGDRALIVIACLSLAGALAIGAGAAIAVSPLIIPLIAFGALAVPAYNLELAGGRFHNAATFALAWGAFPAFTGYFFQSLTVRPAGVLVAIACALLTVAQRRLSGPARELRRQTVALEGTRVLPDGTSVRLTRELLLAPLEGALMASAAALVVLAVALVLVRVS